jgi:hypothetical protein
MFGLSTSLLEFFIQDKGVMRATPSSWSHPSPQWYSRSNACTFAEMGRFIVRALFAEVLDDDH